MKNNKKNILILTISFPRWPNDHIATMYLFELYKRLTDSYNIFFLVPHVKKAKTKEVWQNVNIYRFRYFWPDKLEKLCYGSGVIPKLRKNKFLYLLVPFLFIFQFINICVLLKKERIDIIHAHWFVPSGFTAIIAAKIFRKPSIISSHGPDILNLPGAFWDKTRKFIVKQANLVTVISPTFIKDLVNFYPPVKEKISFISMGIDTELFYFKPKEFKSEQKLLFAGRLSPVKGVSYLIKAMPKILQEFPNAKLEIIGYGEQEDDLRKLVRTLSLDKKINFVGAVENKEMPKYYHSSSVYILPSLVEGLPVALMEAMSCGCPVIATSVGGVPDLIGDGINGILIKTKSIEEISQSVIKILSDNNFRENIIKNAREKIKENYDWQIIAMKFKRLYSEILQK